MKRIKYEHLDDINDQIDHINDEHASARFGSIIMIFGCLVGSYFLNDNWPNGSVGLIGISAIIALISWMSCRRNNDFDPR